MILADCADTRFLKLSKGPSSVAFQTRISASSTASRSALSSALLRGGVASPDVLMHDLLTWPRLLPIFSSATMGFMYNV